MKQKVPFASLRRGLQPRTAAAALPRRHGDAVGHGFDSRAP